MEIYMGKKKWCPILIAALLLAGCGSDGVKNREPEEAQTVGVDSTGANDTKNGTADDTETNGQKDDVTGSVGGQENGNAGTDAADRQDDGVPDDAESELPADGMQAPPTDYVTEELYASADQWDSCDDAALAAVMRKAEAGEPVTIACIGGSITQGTISNGSDDSGVADKKCYADLFFSWWEQTFPDTEFTFINAGIGATDSYIGVHRVQRDIAI